MAMVINSNIMSLTAQRNLASSQAEQNQAMGRLSSGLRINTAKDDAAGLAIAQGLTSQVRGLNQAARNANDGISLVQTAEGALQESTNILQRMRELAVQSANGTYSTGNRNTLDAEVQQLKSELDRIAGTTSFNGQNILDGSRGKIDLQVGAYSNQVISMEIGSMDTKSLGGSGGDIVSAEVTGGSAALTALAASDILTINDQTIPALDTSVDLQAALNTINATLDGFGAEVSTMVDMRAKSVGAGVLVAGTDSLNLRLTDNYGNQTTFEITGTNSLEELATAISDASGGQIEAKVVDGRLAMSAENAENLAFITGGSGKGNATDGIATVTGYDTAAAQTRNFSLVFNDTSADKRGVKIEGADGTDDAAVIATLGLDIHDDDRNLLGIAVTVGALGTKVNEGDLIINGVEIGEIQSGTDVQATADNTIEAINKLSDETGVVAFRSSAGIAAGISLRAVDGGEISIKYGDNATAATVVAMTGLKERNAAEGVGSVSSISISTAAGAQKAIGIIDKALEQINDTRGDLGAVNNRLDSTIKNLTNVSENAASSRSRIMDADFAAESAALARAQVLQQAGTAMLAQANQAPQQVLSLLQ